MTGFQLFFDVVTVPHVGQEMLTLSGTTDFTPLGEFMISPNRYTCIYIYIICQSWDYVYGLMSMVCLPGFLV